MNTLHVFILVRVYLSQQALAFLEKIKLFPTVSAKSLTKSSYESNLGIKIQIKGWWND